MESALVLTTSNCLDSRFELSSLENEKYHKGKNDYIEKHSVIKTVRSKALGGI